LAKFPAPAEVGATTRSALCILVRSGFDRLFVYLVFGCCLLGECELLVWMFGDRLFIVCLFG
jgi:hypothetical protein